ncbi:MAG: hypothetical protein PHQ91_00865 [Thermoanaerobaculaceae bacterium]|nr:hypothetical protein [Thermoanaerobaculaceae bacterium]TAM51664.1 MAG: hypothetical protein EPN53_06675 [Acidobacteriota bacterium]
MELPNKVLVYSQILGLSGTAGTLVDIRDEGCYELRLTSQGKLHVVLLPITQTGLVFAEAEPEVAPVESIER